MLARQPCVLPAPTRKRIGQPMFWRALPAFGVVLRQNAEQLTPTPIERWYRILTHALRHFLKGRVLRPPPQLSRRPFDPHVRVEIRNEIIPTAHHTTELPDLGSWQLH